MIGEQNTLHAHKSKRTKGSLFIRSDFMVLYITVSPLSLHNIIEKSVASVYIQAKKYASNHTSYHTKRYKQVYKIRQPPSLSNRFPGEYSLKTNVEVTLSFLFSCYRSFTWHSNQIDIHLRYSSFHLKQFTSAISIPTLGFHF